MVCGVITKQRKTKQTNKQCGVILSQVCCCRRRVELAAMVVTGG